jgi:hypothetical protein
MKQYYDKILFALALVLLVLGLGFFARTGGLGARPAPPVLAQKPTGPTYQATVSPEITPQTGEWDAPPDQASKDNGEIPGYWIYGVFTPPKIWWNGTWVAKPPKQSGPPPAPFGLYYLGLQRKPYRIQLRGYVGIEPAVTILLTDTQNNNDFDVHVGDANTDENVKVLDFRSVLQQNDDGSVHRAGVVDLQDTLLNQKVSLTEGEILYVEQDRFLAFTTAYPLDVKRWEVTKSGQTFSVGNITYTAQEISLDPPRATIEKDAPNQLPDTETFTKPSPPPPPPLHSRSRYRRSPPSFTNPTDGSSGAPATDGMTPALPSNN